MKKKFSLIIAAALVLSLLASCGQAAPPATTAAATTAAPATTAAAAAETTAAATEAAATTTAAPTTTTTIAVTTPNTPAPVVAEETEGLDPRYAEPVVVSMCVMNAERNGQPEDPRNVYIKDRFNLTFQYIPINWGDWNEKIRTWVATDDSPDLIWWDLKGAQANEYTSWASQGAFSPYKAEYFNNRPSLKHVFDTSPSVPALSVDGLLYAWPSLRDNLPESRTCYTSVFNYRRDWAKAVGLYNEDDNYTWEEWLTLLRAVRDQDPGNNGTGNAVLVLPWFGFPHAPALFIGPPNAEGNETCSYFKDDSGQYVWPPSLPEYKTGVKITHDMYQEGLIYKDNILFTANEQEDMIKAGLAFATYNVTGALNSWTDQMLTEGIINERTDFGFCIVAGWDGTWYMTQTEDYWTVTCLSHKVNEQKIDRILDFWEFLFTVEGIRLRMWGAEGVDFEVTGPAVNDVKSLWEYNEAAGVYINPFTNKYEFNESNGGVNGPGNTWLLPGNPTYAQDEARRLFSTMDNPKFPLSIKVFDYYVSFSQTPNKGKYGTFGSEVKEHMISLMPQTGIDVEAAWDDFVQSMMPRVQLVLDELNG